MPQEDSAGKPLPNALTTKVKTKRDGTVMNSKAQIC